ncbi:FUSC family protein [Pelomonas sp. KK5]|uniref:FUSC family protein n=1 Tax=Pelomonas sp. KK5 TaxID=1855730 RepID=UPI00097CC07C|nr:FUSC family protein [Pelomonas sp. KK5]
MRRLFSGLTAAQINGLSVALGVLVIQSSFAALAGHETAAAAISGAVCTSLPDLPNAPKRTWPRLLPALLATALVTLLVGLGRASPVAMTGLIAAIAFLSLMAMAWGLRAGPLSFSPVLALVFAMAWGVPDSKLDAFEHAGWVLAGGACYALWARLTSQLLRRRYRELALAGAMRACAKRLRSRAARIAGEVPVEELTMRASIADDVLLADALQNARDHIFAARPSPHARRQVDLLLGLIELRDLLLASRLDTEHLGDDAAGLGWRRALATTQRHLADALDGLAAATDRGAAPPQLSAAQWRRELALRLAEVDADVDDEDPRRHLIQAIQGRLGYMLDDIAAMAARLTAPDRSDDAAPFTPEQLRQFVSPEGWPLAALKAHLTLDSGVLRHAIRATLALSLAYAVGHWMPWHAHPHWLVLSVAVVLRGNLEQTLSRRNQRIIGTVIGCLVVAALAHIHDEPKLLGLIFVAAVGTSHAYVNQRYVVAATGATLMALLQPLLLEPGSHPAFAERLADTVVGALVAWAFCFVLPSWERKSLQRLSRQLRGTLARHARNVLRWQPSAEQQLAARLTRQQAYAALAAIAGAAQRTRVEPSHVRLAEAEVEALLTHGYRLMALLGMVQQMIGRRIARLDPQVSAAALDAAAEPVVEALQPHAEVPETRDPGLAFSSDWPEHGQQDLTPWLERRLHLCRREAVMLSNAVSLMLRADSQNPTEEYKP